MQTDHALASPDLTSLPAIRILAVDDSHAQRVLIGSLLASWGFDFTVVDTVEAALHECARRPPDLVLSDWIMPGRDGLDFCRAFRALPRTGYGYFTLLTSKSEKADIAVGLDAGADDFLTKPIHAPELLARIRAAQRLIGTQRALEAQTLKLSETLDALQSAYDSIDRELRQARRIQEALVPERSRRFGGSRVSLLLQPCGHVGGDLVGMFSPAPGKLGVFGIDVSGHGITSAMVAARVAGYLDKRFPDQNIALGPLRNGTHSLRPPADVAALLNSRLMSSRGSDEYLTMLYATLDLARGHLRFVQAGHPALLVLPHDAPPRFLGDGGFPIGLVETADYEQVALRLRPGDRVLIHSDGFLEAQLPGGALLGEDGLLDLVHRVPASAMGTDFLDHLLRGLTNRIGNERELTDDVSAALIEYYA